MVLQAGKPVSLWGWAAAGDKVTVVFDGQEKETVAGDGGTWLLQLDALRPSSKGSVLLVSDGSTTLRIKDVLVGEVWVCGGQSNMEWSLRGSREADLEIDSADSPEIRFLRLPKIASDVPRDDFPLGNPKGSEGRWRRAIPEEVENCTAVGYYFARRLQRRLRNRRRRSRPRSAKRPRRLSKGPTMRLKCKQKRKQNARRRSAARTKPRPRPRRST